MKRTKLMTLFLSMGLMMALTITGCNTKADSPVTNTEVNANMEGGVIGEGETVFDFTVVDTKGKEIKFEVHTDEEIVGEALEELNLIAGEEGDYGLFVKTVNGITLDYEVDGKYWAFYINDAYATSGVDVTPIVEGEAYSFRAE